MFLEIREKGNVRVGFVRSQKRKTAGEKEGNGIRKKGIVKSGIKRRLNTFRKIGETRFWWSNSRLAILTAFLKWGESKKPKAALERLRQMGGESQKAGARWV